MKFLTLIDKLSTYAGYVAAPLPLLAAAVICYELVMRTILHMPTTWASESTILMIAVCYFMGGANNLREDTHVRVDVLYHKLSPRGQAAIDCFTYFVFCLYIVIMLFVIWPYMMESIRLNEHTQTAWNPPIWPLKVIMFVGFSLIMLQGTARFIRNLYFAVKGEQL